MKEADVLNLVRKEAAEKGILLWRNNVGAAKTESGSFIRFGLANDSAGINAQIKSADLIGIRPVVITQEMVGKTVGVFISRECKASGWKYQGTPQQDAQLRWEGLINWNGGDAKIVTSLGSFD